MASLKEKSLHFGDPLVCNKCPTSIHQKNYDIINLLTVSKSSDKSSTTFVWPKGKVTYMQIKAAPDEVMIRN